MELDQKSSFRLNLVRFPLIVGVVIHHAYNPNINLSVTNDSILGFMNYMISECLAFIAVPLFFLMSGFLFYYKFKWSKSAFLTKLRSRLWTLFIPLLFWNLLVLLAIGIAQEIPFTATYFSGGLPKIFSSNIFGYFNLVFGVDRYPIAYQFWFIRDLMIMVLLTPLFHLIHQKVTYIFGGILAFLWFSSIIPDNVLSIIPSSNSLLFFYTGSVLATKKISPFFLDKLGPYLVIVSLALFTVSWIPQVQLLNSIFHKLGIATGVFGALYLTRILLFREKISSSFLWLGTCSFFIFAMHEPLIEVVQRLLSRIFIPISDGRLLVYYYLIPVLIIAVSILVYVLLHRILPRVTSVITGGRLPHQKVDIKIKQTDSSVSY